MIEISADVMRAMLHEDWSNAACIGYAIAAMMRMGASDKDIKAMVANMRTAHDTYTVTQAAQIYMASKY